jgi:hypothetical protein
VLSDRLNAVRSEEQFEQFLDDVDRRRLLRLEERAQWLRTWREQRDDQDRARAHLLAKLQVERDYELKLTNFKLRSDLTERELEAQIKLEQLRLTAQLAAETERAEHALRRRRAEAEWQREADEQRRRNLEESTRLDLALGGAVHDEKLRQFHNELQLGFEALRGLKQTRRDSRSEEVTRSASAPATEPDAATRDEP